jgi:hypothetical protein
MKKILRALSFFLFLLLALPAHAVLPLAALVYTSGGVYANMNLAVALGALMAALAAGIGIGYMSLENTDQSGGTGVGYRVPLTANVVIPPPDAPQKDDPPVTATKYYIGYGGVNITGLHDTQEQACNALPSGGTWIAGMGCYSTGNLYGGQERYPSSTTVSTCADGYKVVGNECLLDNPRKAKPDGNCDYARNGTSLSALDDADCVVAGVRGLVCTSTSCVAVGVNDQGRRERIEIKPTPDGGTVVTTNTENTVGGTPVVDTVTVTIGSGGGVIGVNGDTNTGTVPSDGSSPTNPNTGTGNSDTTFPSDYARSGEAQAAAKFVTDTLGPKLDALTDSLGSDKFSIASGVSPVQAWDDRINAVSGLSASTPVISWVPSILPGTPVGCTAIPIDGTVHGGLLNGMTGTASLDICDKLALVRQILGYLFMVLTTIFVYRRFTRSNASAGG